VSFEKQGWQCNTAQRSAVSRLHRRSCCRSAWVRQYACGAGLTSPPIRPCSRRFTCDFFPDNNSTEFCYDGKGSLADELASIECAAALRVRSAHPGLRCHTRMCRACADLCPRLALQGNPGHRVPAAAARR
jgi:hypothetical protein